MSKMLPVASAGDAIAPMMMMLWNFNAGFVFACLLFCSLVVVWPWISRWDGGMWTSWREPSTRRLRSLCYSSICFIVFPILKIGRILTDNEQILCFQRTAKHFSVSHLNLTLLQFEKKLCFSESSKLSRHVKKFAFCFYSKTTTFLD